MVVARVIVLVDVRVVDRIIVIVDDSVFMVYIFGVARILVFVKLGMYLEQLFCLIKGL